MYFKPMNRICRRICLGAVLAVPAAVVALAGSPLALADGALDYQKLEGAITDTLNDQYAQISREVSDVECPRSETPPKTGDTITCNAVVDGQTVRVAAEVQDDDYNVHFATLDTLFDLERTAEGLDPAITDQVGFPVTVTCGTGLKVVAIGDSFECTAADSDGDSRTVKVTAGPVGEDDTWEVIE